MRPLSPLVTFLLVSCNKVAFLLYHEWLLLPLAHLVFSKNSRALFSSVALSGIPGILFVIVLTSCYIVT